MHIKIYFQKKNSMLDHTTAMVNQMAIIPITISAQVSFTCAPMEEMNTL